MTSPHSKREVKELHSVKDLTRDRRNANRGTTRGYAVVEESLSRYGAGRSTLVDRNGRIIAGNTTTTAYESNGNEDIIVVKTDGSKLVVVQRTDLDLETDPAARELAHADNRSTQVGYDPDVVFIDSDIADGCDLEWLWRLDELAELREGESAEPGDDEHDKDQRTDPGFRFTVICHNAQQLEEARAAVERMGYVIK